MTTVSAKEASAFIKRHKLKVKLGDSTDIALHKGLRSSGLTLEDKQVLLVEGDLDVKGALFDIGAYNEDDYGYLLVSGRIRCDALIWGGSPIFALKGIEARHFAYFNSWGQGHLQAGVSFNTPVLMTEDNEITAKVMKLGRVFILDPDSWHDDTASPLKPGAIPKALFSGKVLDVDKLKKAAGKPLKIGV